MTNPISLNIVVTASAVGRNFFSVSLLNFVVTVSVVVTVSLSVAEHNRFSVSLLNVVVRVSFVECYCAL